MEKQKNAEKTRNKMSVSHKVLCRSLHALVIDCSLSDVDTWVGHKKLNPGGAGKKKSATGLPSVADSYLTPRVAAGTPTELHCKDGTQKSELQTFSPKKCVFYSHTSRLCRTGGQRIENREYFQTVRGMEARPLGQRICPGRQVALLHVQPRLARRAQPHHTAPKCGAVQRLSKRDENCVPTGTARSTVQGHGIF